MYLEIFKLATLIRCFEESVYNKIKEGYLKIPIYLCSGQEMIYASLAYYYKNINPLIFAQHRCHGVYLAFGGNAVELIDELLGFSTGCTGGKGGSASIHCPKINMFGHDGLMGTQVPIAVGACFTSRKPTLVFIGDAAAEEDYVMSSIAWAGTKKLPITFIVEDNNLSILTEKKERRNWEMDIFASSVNVNSINIIDCSKTIMNALDELKQPSLLNIKTIRHFWHAGAGIDLKQEEIKNESYFLLKKEINNSEEIINNTQKYIDNLWISRLEKQLKI